MINAGIKAMMVITMMSGDVYETKLPSLSECYAQKPIVVGQLDVKSAACLPHTDEPREDNMAKFKAFFEVFMQLIEQAEDRCHAWDGDWDSRNNCG